jgi:hypothetical protein
MFLTMFVFADQGEAFVTHKPEEFCVTPMGGTLGKSAAW